MKSIVTTTTTTTTPAVVVSVLLLLLVIIQVCSVSATSQEQLQQSQWSVRELQTNSSTTTTTTNFIGEGCVCSGPSGVVSGCLDTKDFNHCSCDVLGFLFCSEDEEVGHNDDEHTDDEHTDGDGHDHDGEDGNGCHCDGLDIHCTLNPAAEDVCECHNHGGVVEVHCQEVHQSCHCDGSVVHCSSESQELVAESLCHCHDGMLECGNGSGEEELRSNDDDKPWAEVIVTTLIVNLVSLAGLVVVGGQWLNRLFCKNRFSEQTVTQWRGNIIPMFACGAVLATAFFLILPEALLLIGEDFASDDPHAGHNHRLLREKNPEAQTTWRWGTSILGGFLIPVLAHAFFPHNHGHDHEHGHEHGHNHTSRGVDEILKDNDKYVSQRQQQQQQADATKGGNDSSSVDETGHTKAGQTEMFDMMTSDDGDNGDNGSSSTNGNRPSSNNGDGDGENTTVVAAASTGTASDTNTSSDPESAGGSAAGGAHSSLISTKDNTNGDAAGDLLPQGFRDADAKYNVELLVSLSVGDFTHQFADGVFIGTAWYLCSRELAITVAIATILHCFPHQLADYLLMVHHCGLKEWQAILLNFVTGFGMLLGGILVLAIDMSNTAIGCILAIGGGIFLHVAISDCLGVADRTCTRPIHKLWGFLAFCVGAIPIGLILLNHQHCHAH